jgi:acyl-CoA hydrolase
MITPIQQRIHDKKRTAKQIIEMIRPGEWINSGTIGGDSLVCMDELAARLGPNPADLQDIEIWNYGHYVPLPRFEEVDPEEKYHCFQSYFFFPWNRKARDARGVNSWTQWGWALGSWWHHYRFTGNQQSDRRIDWWFNAASPPDQSGYFNWSYGTNCCNIYRQTSKRLVVEVRSDYPWAEGGRFNTIHIDDVDYWVEVDCEKYAWPQADVRNVKISEEEKRIAQHILSIMDDRDVVQLGIGSLPNACIRAIAEAGLKDLGIHTEMLNPGLVNLILSGQVTNRYKNIDRGRSVWTFAFPQDTQLYYDVVHHNQALAVYDIDYTNNLHVLTHIDHMIAIDNCLAIDLLGQQSAGFYKMRPISNTGGYLHFVGFCGQSRGGRGVCVMTSRNRRGEPRIVPFLPEGSIVDLPAQLAHYVCTEYGIANLRGLNGYERTTALISLAHPDDRENLERAAHAYGLLPRCFPVDMLPKEGELRRYPSYQERRNYKIPYNSLAWGYDWDPTQSGE